MKRIFLIAFFSLLLFSVAIAIVDTRTDIIRIATPLILDVSCFNNEVRVPARVRVSEIDATGRIIDGTGTSVWSGDGRVSFSLAPGKSYRITADKARAEGPVELIGTRVPRDIINFQHSTAIGLVLERRRAEGK